MITKKYTLIELLISMAIFVVMMGILTKTFSMAADISSSETTKVNILNDASVFFNYITKDLRAAEIENIIQLKDADDAALHPEDASSPQEATNSDVGKKMYFTSTSLGFFSDVEGYDIDQDGSDDFSGISPYVRYELSSGKIVRELWDNVAEAAPNNLAAYPNTNDYLGDKSPIILDGVEDLSIRLWEDFPGGTEITQSPVEIAPACITISVSLTMSNPDAHSELKKKHKRTITKALYINR